MIRLIEFGKASDKAPLIAIPGIDGSIGSIEPIVKKMALNRQVIVVDYTEESNLTLEELSSEIAEEIRKKNFGKIDILGQSIGTILAAQVASVHGLAIQKVILICTFTKLGWNKLRISNFVMRITPKWLFKLSSRATMTMVCGPVGDGKEHPFFASSKKTNKAAVIKRTGWEINRDFAEDLIKVTTPSLILMGEKDRFVPDLQRELDKLKRIFADYPAKVVAIPEAGHVLLPSSAIAIAVDQIESFLGE